MNPTFLRFLIFMVCLFIFPIVHHLENVEGLTLELMVDFFIFIEFQSLKVTYTNNYKLDNSFFGFVKVIFMEYL